jgi:lipid A disaccharide synthetase
MLLKRTASQTSSLHRQFAKVAIMAGNPSWDTQGSILIKEIQSQTKDQVTFFGLGGDKMKKAGLGQNYGTVSKMHDKQFYPYQNVLKNMWDVP